MQNKPHRKRSILLVGGNPWLIKALYWLVDSELDFSVIATCYIQDVIMTSKWTTPDIVLFLPEISFINCQETLSLLHSTLPHASLILITAADAALYEATIPKTDIYEFISLSSLNTNLLPKLRNSSSKTEDISI